MRRTVWKVVRDVIPEGGHTSVVMGHIAPMDGYYQSIPNQFAVEYLPGKTTNAPRFSEGLPNEFEAPLFAFTTLGDAYAFSGSLHSLDWAILKCDSEASILEKHGIFRCSRTNSDSIISFWMNYGPDRPLTVLAPHGTVLCSSITPLTEEVHRDKERSQ